MLEVISFTLGPVSTNAYLLQTLKQRSRSDDPAWDGRTILKAAQDRGWRIGHLWYTHAHFDHIGGAAEIADALNPLPLVALHPMTMSSGARAAADRSSASTLTLVRADD